jgi:hypothetical protein
VIVALRSRLQDVILRHREDFAEKGGLIHTSVSHIFKYKNHKSDLADTASTKQDSEAGVALQNQLYGLQLRGSRKEPR